MCGVGCLLGNGGTCCDVGRREYSSRTISDIWGHVGERLQRGMSANGYRVNAHKLRPDGRLGACQMMFLCERAG